MAKFKIETDKQARAVAHAEKRVEIAVDEVPRLYLVVQPAPSTVKSWAWRALPKGGKMIKKTLGKFGDFDLAAAKAWAAERNAEFVSGVDVEAVHRAEQEAKAAAQAAKADRDARTVEWYYTKLYKPRYLATPSRRETARLFERHLIPSIGEKPLLDITRRDLSAIVNKIAETAPVSANGFVNVVKTFFTRAITDFGDQTEMEVSPAIYLAKPNPNEYKNRKQPTLDVRGLGIVALTVNEIAAGTGFKAVYAQALKLVLATGVRISEALEAPWSEFDLEKGWWTIAANRSKNRIMHLLPLAPATVEWLKAHRARQVTDAADRRKAGNTKVKDAVYLFSIGGDAPLSCETSKPQAFVFSEANKRAAKSKLILEWSPHALRRTFSTLLSAMTDDDLNPLVPPHVVEALLNHQSGAKAGVAGVYNKHKYHREKAAALMLWENFLVKAQAEARVKEPAPIAA